MALDFRELLTGVDEALLEMLNLCRHFSFGEFTPDDRVPGMAQDNNLAATNACRNRDAAKYLFSF